MSNLIPKIATQLHEFINSGHIYTDELSEETIEKIHAAAEKEADESVPANITRRKGKARRSTGPQYPSEWAKSRDSFLKAVSKFQAKSFTPLHNKNIGINNSKFFLPAPTDKTRNSVLDDFEEIPRQQSLRRATMPNIADNYSISTIPKEITSLFHGIEKLDDNNWSLWKGHMHDNLDLCDLWDIVTGDEPRPRDSDTEELQFWNRREKIARIIVKNSLGIKDYSQVRHTRNVTEIWNTLTYLHQSTGAQGKADLIWKFWATRCEEGASVRLHVGEIRSLHLELAELGIVIERYLLAIVLCKSLPPSYDNFVSTIFASMTDLENADPDYIARKIFEEDMRRSERSEDANLATQIKCQNCNKKGHLKSDCYSKGGGKEGQGPRQIARRKKEEADSKVKQVQLAEDNAFHVSHMASAEKSQDENCSLSTPKWSHDTWIADSGASSHIANRREMFTEYTPTNGILNVAGGLTASIEGTGVVIMQRIVDTKPSVFRLLDVLYVPTNKQCLVSCSKLDKAGGKLIYGNKSCQFYNKNGNLIVDGNLDGNLYKINAKAVLCKNDIANSASASGSSWNEAHRKLGHISLTSLKHILNKKLVEGIKIDKDEPVPHELFCESCILAKAHRLPFPLQSIRKSKNFGDLTHSDVWGSPHVKQTPGGNQYFILFIDDYTRFVTVKLMKNKSCVKQQIMNYCNFIHTQHGRWPKKIKADNASEYEGTRAWLEQKGIELATSAPYSPQQNGVSERMNRTLLDLARAMRFEKKLPETLWGEAVLHAAWIRNRCPTTALDGNTPIRALTGIRPDLSNIREFGETVYVLEEIPRAKTEPRARKVIFTGFEDSSKAIRYYDENTKNIRISRNYKFSIDQNTILENENKNRTEKTENPSNTESNLPNAQNTLSDSKDSNAQSRSLRSVTQSGKSTRKNYADLIKFNPRQYIRQKKYDNSIYAAPRTSTDTSLYVESKFFSNLASKLMIKNGDESIPDTIEQARQSHESDGWEKAIQTELKTLKEKNTWELVSPPKDSNIIGNRWVFTKKYDENGNFAKYKARLVAKGYSQGYIYDYSDTFSPVIRFESFRLLIAIAAYHHLEIGQMDIKGAYLNGNLSDNLYMQQPVGCDDGTGRVCHLIHTLYGLKQSGREWNKTLKKFLVEEAGYTQLIKEYGMFCRHDSKGYDIIAVWVDDLFIVSTSNTRLENTKEQIKLKWESTDQGEPKLLLGIHLDKDSKTNTIKIHQKLYIARILRRFGMEDCSPVYTPLPPSIVYTPCSEDEIFPDQTKYRAAIGSLMFAAIATRPDIAYATNFLSQFNGKASQKHWNAIKHIFRYLKFTIDTGIMYDRTRHTEPKFTLTAYSDADNGKNHDRKSISGFVIVIAGGAIKWAAEKQRLITVSTAESEYVAANLAGRNCLFLRDIMEDLRFKHEDPIPLFMDSDGAIAISKNPENMRATIHIDKIFHWIRQHVDMGTFSPESIPSEHNPADIFTKSLPKDIFEKHKLNIGIL